MSNIKVYRTKLPTSIILGAIALGVVLLAFVFFAFFYTSQPIISALKTGVIVEKRFDPSEHREERITIGGAHGVQKTISDGEYTLFVEVPKPGGHRYEVSMPNQEQYDKYKVGDKFDVGPYLVK